jgi:hypothetical protein
MSGIAAGFEAGILLAIGAILVALGLALASKFATLSNSSLTPR